MSFEGSEGGDRLYTYFLSVPGDSDFCFRKWCDRIYVLVYGGWFLGEQAECDEGELEWVDIDKVENLNIWEGDKIFLRLLRKRKEFFSLKLVYDGKDGLISASLDGKPIEL